MKDLLINGRHYDYASIEIDVDGRKFYLLHGQIDYAQELERGMLRAGAILIVPTDEWEELLRALGDGYMEKPFSITVAYANDGHRTMTDKLQGCRIRRIRRLGPNVELSLHVLWIEENGIKPFRERP